MRSIDVDYRKWGGKQHYWWESIRKLVEERAEPFGAASHAWLGKLPA